MLTEKEMHLIRDSRVYRFGAYLQYAYLVCWDIEADISCGCFPDRKKLIQSNQRNKYVCDEFDLVYLRSEDNPALHLLYLEQTAWRLLSPHVHQHVVDFDNYLNCYHPPQLADLDSLLALAKNSNLIHKKWNIISDLYKVKESGLWDDLALYDNSVRVLIEELKQYQIGEPQRELYTQLPKFRQDHQI